MKKYEIHELIFHTIVEKDPEKPGETIISGVYFEETDLKYADMDIFQENYIGIVIDDESGEIKEVHQSPETPLIKQAQIRKQAKEIIARDGIFLYTPPENNQTPTRKKENAKMEQVCKESTEQPPLDTPKKEGKKTTTKKNSKNTPKD